MQSVTPMRKCTKYERQAEDLYIKSSPAPARPAISPYEILIGDKVYNRHAHVDNPHTEELHRLNHMAHFSSENSEEVTEELAKKISEEELLVHQLLGDNLNEVLLRVAIQEYRYKSQWAKYIEQAKERKIQSESDLERDIKKFVEEHS